MSKSTKSRPADKPAKPVKDFPLFAHSNGSWAKKVRGKLHYFGGWGDPDAALNEWLRQKDDLLAGRVPRAKDEDGLTVKRLADTFLTAKRRRVDSGELSARSYRDYVTVCQTIADTFGKDRLVSDLRPSDFASLRAAWAKSHGPYRLRKDVCVARMLFKFGAKWVRLNDHDDPAKRTYVDSVAQEFRKVMQAQGVNGHRAFYSIRHSHRTAAGEAKDKAAADLVMGHADGGMAGEYTHHISDDRLRAVVDVVRQWLFASAEK